MPGLGTGQQMEAVNGREDAGKGVKWASDGENATARRSVKFQHGNIMGDEQEYLNWLGTGTRKVANKKSEALLKFGSRV